MISLQKKTDPFDLLPRLISAEIPVAIWRNPETKQFNLVADLSTTPSYVDHQELNTEEGFVISPFFNDHNKSLIIKSDVLITENTCRVPEQLEHQHTDNRTIRFTKGPTTEYSKKDFIRLVSKEIKAIKKGDFHKLVAARTVDMPFKRPFDIENNLKILSAKYPAAMVFFFFHPEAGYWMGATPETLIEVKSKKYFRTVALAGTQLYKEHTDLMEVAWRQKEIEEQALVSRFIINCFKKVRVREFEESGPKTFRAGNLVHLKSDFIVDMEAIGYPELAANMLDLLHPTSAVCGMPKEKALEYIRKNETIEREMFSGFAGPLNIDDNTHFYVLLRCMQLFEGFARLYAGAGITSFSDPELEWEETAHKFNTLAGAIDF